MSILVIYDQQKPQLQVNDPVVKFQEAVVSFGKTMQFLYTGTFKHRDRSQYTYILSVEQVQNFFP